jgi:hypothetical protein
MESQRLSLCFPPNNDLQSPPIGGLIGFFQDDRRRSWPTFQDEFLVATNERS